MHDYRRKEICGLLCAACSLAKRTWGLSGVVLCIPYMALEGDGVARVDGRRTARRCDIEMTVLEERNGDVS